MKLMSRTSQKQSYGSRERRGSKYLSISNTEERMERKELNSREKIIEFWKAPVTTFYANMVCSQHYVL